MRGLIALLCSDSIVCRALTMASCCAWLLEHLLSSFSFIWAADCFPVKIAEPDPTPCSYLLPSVCINMCMYVCVYVRMYVCIYVCMYICMCVCKHVFMCVCIAIDREYCYRLRILL